MRTRVTVRVWLAVLIAATTNRDWSIAWTGSGSVRRTRAARVVMSLALLVGLLIVSIALTGGFSIDVGGRTISVRMNFIYSALRRCTQD